MSRFTWRGLARFLHRDLGYLLFGLTVAYCVSGLALNHLHDWNPNYSITQRHGLVPVPGPDKSFTKADARKLLDQAEISAPYQSHYAPADQQVKVFFEGGSVALDCGSGQFTVETIKRRPLLTTFNRLHYNPRQGWTWFADIFSAGLLVVAVTGLFLLRGHHGITRRGGLLVGLGILLPTIFVLLCL